MLTTLKFQFFCCPHFEGKKWNRNKEMTKVKLDLNHFIPGRKKSGRNRLVQPSISLSHTSFALQLVKELNEIGWFNGLFLFLMLASFCAAGAHPEPQQCETSRTRLLLHQQHRKKQNKQSSFKPLAWDFFIVILVSSLLPQKKLLTLVGAVLCWEEGESYSVGEGERAAQRMRTSQPAARGGTTTASCIWDRANGVDQHDGHISLLQFFQKKK